MRPPPLPAEASRWVRVDVARGSMPYSAVTQPFPVLEERRNAVLDARRADDAGPSDFDEDRAFCVKENPGVRLRRPQFRRHPSVATCHVSPFSVLTHFEVFLQGMPEVDVSGQRVDLLALDEDLHALDRRQVGRERVDDR